MPIPGCRLAHVTLVVQVPGLGDDIRAIKAGILEIADILVVNKADLDGAHRVVRDLKAMLAMWTKDTNSPVPHVLKTESLRGVGSDELAAAILEQSIRLSSDDKATQALARLERRFQDQLREHLFAAAVPILSHESSCIAVADALRARQIDPDSAARKVTAALLASRTRGQR